MKNYSVRMFLKGMLEDTAITRGRRFAFFIQALILFSLVTFSVDTLPGLSVNVRKALALSEEVSVGIFTIEYLLRIYVADSKPLFIFSFFGVIDLIAILPFYLSLGLDLRSLRVFRLLRLFRIFKLLRYSVAINRFSRAMAIVKEELILFFSVAMILIYLSAVGIYYCERYAQPDNFQSVFSGLWWAVVTLTTVGYGDVYPVTVGGRIFTFFILMLGLGVVAVPTGLLASALSQTRYEERD